MTLLNLHHYMDLMQYPLICGEITRRDTCSMFIFPTKTAVPTVLWGKHKARCMLQSHFSPLNQQCPQFCGEISRRDSCPRPIFPTKTIVPTILWGNHKARNLLQVHSSPQKPQCPQFCGESSRRNVCFMSFFPHKNRSTHCFVGNPAGAKPAPGTFFHTKHAVPTIMWGNFQPPGPWQFSIYNMSKKTDLLQRFHKKS